MIAALEEVPDTCTAALQATQPSMWPIIHRILWLACTFPFSSCECERSISCIRRLKTYMRSTMGQQRLTALALLHTHYDMEIDFDAVVTRFLTKYPSRITCHEMLAEAEDEDTDGQ